MRKIFFIVVIVTDFFPSCPVCGKNLSEFTTAHEQEEHVKSCLEGGVGTVSQPARYLVYRLPGESLLIGTECMIFSTSRFTKFTIIVFYRCDLSGRV